MFWFLFKDLTLKAKAAKASMRRVDTAFHMGSAEMLLICVYETGHWCSYVTEPRILKQEGAFMIVARNVYIRESPFKAQKNL